MNDLFPCSDAYDLVKIDKTRTDISHFRFELGLIPEKLLNEVFNQKKFILRCSSARVYCSIVFKSKLTSQFDPIVSIFT